MTQSLIEKGNKGKRKKHSATDPESLMQDPSRIKFVDNRETSTLQHTLAMAMNNRQQQVSQRLQFNVHQGVAVQLKTDDSESKIKEITGVLQRTEHQDEELIQGKFNSQSQANDVVNSNDTGLPDNLKAGIENLSGHSMDDVRVHFNSDKPSQLQAHAYAQGTDIYISPGQEKHLAHEAWHVAQQKQGRVKPTVQVKGGVNINDDQNLEKEADVMGAKALQMKVEARAHSRGCGCTACTSVQRVLNKTAQFKCKVCGANSHSTSKCPKQEAEDSGASSSGGRGLTAGSKAHEKILDILIEKLDRDSMYDEGAKSLVGGSKGKPSGLKDKSARIDRQKKGNIQFQIGKDSYACVIFKEGVEPAAIVEALYESLATGGIIYL